MLIYKKKITYGFSRFVSCWGGPYIKFNVGDLFEENLNIALDESCCQLCVADLDFVSLTVWAKLLCIQLF